MRLTTLPERLTLDACLDSWCASGDWYSTVFKIQTKICKNERQVKVQSF